ncbi:hypothetical protein D3C81_1119250 [compost metagenome]
MIAARVASVPSPQLSLSFCFRRGSATWLAMVFIALTSVPSVYALGGCVRFALSVASISATFADSRNVGNRCACSAGSLPSASLITAFQPRSRICLPRATS